MPNVKMLAINQEPEPTWSKTQQRLLDVLQCEENRKKPPREICRLAGYHPPVWYQAIHDANFILAIEALGVRVRRNKKHNQRENRHEVVRSQAKQALLEILQREGNTRETARMLWLKAGYSSSQWYRVIEDKEFVAAVEALGGKVRSHSKHVRREQHISVTLATNIEEELNKDVWDMRRLKSDYPKHYSASTYVVNFSWIANPLLRQQLKQYFRLHLPKWKPKTFANTLYEIKPFLASLPPEVHVGLLERAHVEAFLPSIGHLSERQAHRCIVESRAMLEYMATSPAWTGARPPRFLIWPEEVPSGPETLPRPIPPNVIDQLDLLLEQAIQEMVAGQPPTILEPVLWDAVLMLRRTGMRLEDLAHLKAPDVHGRNGCLDQDSDGYWWVRIHYKITKMGKDHRIPTRLSDGVVDGVRRQQERVRNIPDHFGENYLFRTENGVLTTRTFSQAMRHLAPHLMYEGQSYVITAHQFRHTIATDMIEQGVDIYTVKEFLGHTSLKMTEKYIAVYLKSLKAKYDAYRAKKQQTYATEMMTNLVQVKQDAGDTDGGWVEGKVGKLYISPLPDGIGNCAHLAMHDPCPDTPHCPTCPKLRANKRHLPFWESKAQNLLITVEALRSNPTYARARQKHEQELHHAEKVIQTIKEEGFWDGRIHNS